MVIQAEPVAQALDSLPERGRSLGHVILTAPSGRTFTQRDAERLSAYPTLTFVCGRYEGVDARLNIEYVNEVLSIGDYVLSGGELAAMVMIDAIARLHPGALNNSESAENESHSLSAQQLLEHPHYTRPATWRGHEVPPVLLSGHHARIQAWRRRESIKVTAQARPEILKNIELTQEERALVARLTQQENNDELA
jgi:tRNA (guanine37-N1)-methyltransferase